MLPVAEPDQPELRTSSWMPLPTPHVCDVFPDHPAVLDLDQVNELKPDFLECR